jgi:hypothetical protein
MTNDVEMARKKALMMAATGIPAMMLSVFGLLFTFKKTGHSFTAPALWVALGVVTAIFALYFGFAWTIVKRAHAEAARPQPPQSPKK